MDGQYVSLDALTTPALEESDVEVPGVGVVRVRALSRAEVLRIQRMGGDKGAAELEVMTLAAGMVAPRMTEADARTWQAASRAGGVIGVVTQRIRELSGMDPDAPKEAYKSAGGES